MITYAGIDFGNSNCVIAIPKPTGVEVVLNQSSNRLTPAMVTYTDERRFSGELSSQQQLQYNNNTITDLKRLVMLPFQSELRKKLSKTLPLVELDDGTTGINISYHDHSLTLRPEQCIAYLLKEMANLSGKENFVITVAPWWSEKHRRAMSNACKIAGINCVALLNTTTAAAITYALQHRERLPKPNEPPVPVAFVDIGDSSMNVTIAIIKQQNVEIKAISYNDEINGSLFTDRFEQYLLEKVYQKYKIDPTSSSRAMLRFRQAVEKAKKVLSVNPIVQFEVHSIMNTDISFLVQREEFNDQIKDIIEENLEKTIQEALEISKIDKNKIFELQLLGGTTRVLAVKDSLTKFFGKEPKKSLNLDECFAIGSAYMAAYLSPKMSVPIIVKDISPHSLTAHWKDGSYEVFKKFNHIPAVKLFDVKVKERKTIYLSNEIEDIGKIHIETGLPHTTKVTIRIRLTQSCTIDVVDAIFEKEGKTTEAKITYHFYGDMNQKQILEYKELEDKMAKNDNDEMKIDDARNELESQLLSIHNDINKNLLDYVEPSLLDKVKSTINQIELWFEEKEFDRLPFNEYISKADILKNLVKPIQIRMNSHQSLMSEVLTMKNDAMGIINHLENDSIIQNDPSIEQLMNNTIEFMQELSEIKEIPKYQNISVDIEELRSKICQLHKSYDGIKEKHNQ
ncbi:dnaK protein [Tritrichomonas foetus]|uniref:DnaK protein n=1 Tax=Tritrichomonas foetus TaxID=1144522 RepID=A0A1J4KFZ0_9EUKA|nr:dnaK protein [Tritrichomonas foetus]|eukprot:OHT10329.1 dnaK protein [Tritrichomonas foetus]